MNELDWIVRIYHNFSTESRRDLLFRKMLEHSLNVDLCDSDRVLRLYKIQRNVFPMIWRFLPLLDPLVDRFMSRDTDAELINREKEAVSQWLASNATFHAMRDHPWHCNIEMLGGEEFIFNINTMNYYQGQHQACGGLKSTKDVTSSFNQPGNFSTDGCRYFTVSISCYSNFTFGL